MKGCSCWAGWSMKLKSYGYLFWLWEWYARLWRLYYIIIPKLYIVHLSECRKNVQLLEGLCGVGVSCTQSEAGATLVLLKHFLSGDQNCQGRSGCLRWKKANSRELLFWNRGSNCRDYQENPCKAIVISLYVLNMSLPKQNHLNQFSKFGEAFATLGSIPGLCN
jgi:hypothetical protein